MTATSTAAFQFKDAFYQVVKTMFANDAQVLVAFGVPDVERSDDMIFFLDVTSAQDIATMTLARSREETLTLQVYVHCHKAGEPDNDRVASARFYALLGQIENYVRTTDTTLGGSVRQCFLTSHNSTGHTASDQLGGGRIIDGIATFTALVRITN